jgi:hypothetical protein
VVHAYNYSYQEEEIRKIMVHGQPRQKKKQKTKPNKKIKEA